MKPRVLVVVGTRPEAIKLAPVILALRRDERVNTAVCATAQHRALLDQMLRLFDIVPEFDLDLMREAQPIPDFVGAAIPAVRRVVEDWRPHLVVVQGDTATTYAATMAAFYGWVPVAHVEAGLRSGDMAHPFPEEMHRRQVAGIAALHFAPTMRSAEALAAEGIDKARIHMTGNSGIDALHLMLGRIDTDAALRAALDAQFAHLNPAKRLLLVTTHRRESLGAPLAGIVEAISEIAQRQDVEILLPMHPNPAVRDVLRPRLGRQANVHLTEPLDYPAFVHALRRAHAVLTDSGGVQEEAPAVGCPVLVLRHRTERQEGTEAGAAQLVGLEPRAIVDATERLLADEAAHAKMRQRGSPYGDGQASQRIAGAIVSFLSGEVARIS